MNSQSASMVDIVVMSYLMSSIRMLAGRCYCWPWFKAVYRNHVHCYYRPFCCLPSHKRWLVALLSKQICFLFCKKSSLAAERNFKYIWTRIFVLLSFVLIKRKSQICLNHPIGIYKKRNRCENLL